MDDLMNTGAYGLYALTVLSNAASKVLPMFNKIPNMAFTGHAVYTTLPVGGAYRGYGATQGYFAFNQHVDARCRKVGEDFVEYVKKWHIREGETSEVFRAIGEGTEGVSQIVRSCKLNECLDRGAEEIRWKELRGKRLRSGSVVKGVGAAVSMQGSGIAMVDMGSASMKMNDDGSFNLFAGATDIGTGSDTILSQIAAERLGIPVEMIVILSSDTDLTPFDTGAYASSTTYISGQAVLRCAEERWRTATVHGFFDDRYISGISIRRKGNQQRRWFRNPFSEIACYSMYSRNQFQIQARHPSVKNHPSLHGALRRRDVDMETGRVRVVTFVSAGDCGQPINPALALGQIEGATLNGISYALTEQYLFDEKGKMTNNSFWDYKIYGSLDIPEVKAILAESSEPSGPYGAKSISEIGINGPAPAIANAIFDAVGIRLRELPMTPEKVLAAIKAKAGR